MVSGEIMKKQNYLIVLTLSLAMHTHLDAAQMNIEMKEQETKQLTAEEQAAVNEMFDIIETKNENNQAEQAKKLQTLLQRYPQIIEMKDKEGWTALMAAAANGKADAIQLLVSAGAKLYAKNEWNRTAWDIAVLRIHPEIYGEAVVAGLAERKRYLHAQQEAKKKLEKHMISPLAQLTTEYAYHPQILGDLPQGVTPLEKAQRITQKIREKKKQKTVTCKNKGKQ